MALPQVDPETICRLKYGDEAAFEAIFNRYHTLLYQFALTYVKSEEQAKEITQEAFIQLWTNRDKLSSALPLYPYLFTHVRRATIDAYRKHAVATRYIQDYMHSGRDYHEETEAYLGWKELKELTDSAIDSLPEHQRRVFMMSRFEGLSYEQISDDLGISKHTVKYHLMSALKTLKRGLAHYEISCTILFYFFL